MVSVTRFMAGQFVVDLEAVRTLRQRELLSSRDRTAEGKAKNRRIEIILVPKD